MLKIREQQLAELRRLQIGDALLDSMLTSRLNATRDAATSDILVTDANANTTRIGFDKRGFIGSVTSPLGRKWSLDNDRDGKMLALSGPAGNRITFEYDLQSNVSEISVERRKLLEIKYGPANLPAQIAFPDGTTRRLEYDDAGRVSGVIDRVDGKATYEYDPAGNPITIIDGNGNRTRFSYSGKPRPDAAHFPDGSSETYRYNANGTLRAIAIGTQNLAELAYDGDGRVVKVSHSDGEVVTYNYDDDGLLVEASNSQATISCLYDGDGRITEESDGEHGIQYDYDASGSLIGMTYPSGERVAFEYDPDLRLHTVRDWHGGEHRFRYAADERTIDVQSPNGLTTKSVHTPTGLPIAVTVLRDIEEVKRELFSLKFTYDSEDRLLTFADSKFGLRHYGYDAEGQLLSVDADDIERRESFAYDKGGNRIRCNAEVASTNAVNQMTSQGAMQCSYDARGNVVAITSPDGARRFTYNSRNLMIRAEDQIGRVTKFSYDAFGRRISKQSGTTHARYVWAGENMVREITTDGNATRIQDYLYYPGTHTPLATRIDGRIYTYHCDHLGTPRRLTDEDGTVVWSAEYAAFGEATVKIDNVWNPLRLPGQYFDHETGLHYNRFRYYAPKFGRYLSRDPVTFVGGLNFYMYSDNNPINGADPLGLWSWKTVVAVGAAVAVGVAVVALAPIALPLAIVAAGAAAGAVGAGLNEALNQEKFNLKCILQAALKGAIVGTIAALPFAFLPAAAGVVAYTATGAASGGLGYTADHLLTPGSKWDWVDFAKAVGIGAATAGVGRYLGGKYSQWKSARANPSAAADEAAALRPVEERPCVGEPIDTATGEVIMEKVDIKLPGALELLLKRTYASNLEGESCFGPKWRGTWGQWVELNNELAAFYSDNGSTVRFVLDAKRADADGWLRNPLVNKVRLRREANGFAVRDAERCIRRFERKVGDRWLLTRIEDANGNNIQFDHDTDGALRAVTHSGGYKLRITATPSQIRRIELIEHDNQAIELMRYEYDAAGCLAAVIDGSGKPFRYQYDSGARVTRWQDRERTWYAYRYDEKGRCVEAFGPEGMYHYRLSYDEGKRTTRSVDSLGGVTISEHNSRLQLVRRTDARGGVTRTVWDSRSNKLKEIDPEGRTIEWTYDDDGRVLTVIDSSKGITQLAYNDLGLPTTAIDPNGKVWIRIYDERGNLLEAGLSGDAPWRYERDAHGNATRVIDPQGGVRQFAYDDNGRLSWATDWKQHRTRYRHDALGRVVEEIDRLGNKTQFSYAALGKLAEVTLPTGDRLRWDYDSEGNVTRQLEANGVGWSYRYGVFDLLKETGPPAGGTRRFTHDTEARLTAIENERKETYRYEYNATGDIIIEEDFSGRRVQFAYDASGQCVKRVNGKGEETFYSRDAGGQLVGKRSSDSYSVFEYDACGRMIAAKNNVIDIRFERDAYGRIVREIQGDRIVESAYDPRGLRTRRKTSSGHEIEWQFDANGQLSSLRLPADEVVKFVHDNGGREVERHLPGDVLLRQDFDSLNRLTRQWVGGKASKSMAAVVERNYAYDETGNPVEIQDSYWGRNRFDYDAAGRILAAQRERGVSEEFDYDLAGDIMSEKVKLLSSSATGGLLTAKPEARRYGRGGRLEQASDTTYVYDADGRVIEKRDGLHKWRLDWTTGGHLRKVQSPDGGETTFEYDALDRRVKRTGRRGSEIYLWDGDVVADEIRGSSTSTWIYAPGSFVPLAKHEAGVTYNCITDQLGTPRELVRNNGRIAWSAQLNTWGAFDQAGAAETDCPIRFQGQWWDDEINLSYNFHRYYDPVTGSYLSPDPLGIAGGARLHGYVHNPLTWIDPLGLAGCENTTFATRKQAFNAAKDRAGIPRSQQPSQQGTFRPRHPDSSTGGAGTNITEGNPSAQGRWYKYETPEGPKYIIEHDVDPNAVNPHFHAATDKPGHVPVSEGGNYQPVDGKHHMNYPK